MNIIISKELTKTECIHAPATPVSECSNTASALSAGTSPLPHFLIMTDFIEKIPYP